MAEAPSIMQLKLAARSLRVAALHSLGRDDEIATLPPIEGSVDVPVQSVSSSGTASIVKSVLLAEGETRPRRITGTVKWFSAEKGFGFITPDDGSHDLFAHYSFIEAPGSKSPEEGERVEFDVPPATVVKRPRRRA